MSSPSPKPAFFNLIAYKDEDDRSYIGHLDQDTELPTPLSFASGTRAENLDQLSSVPS